MTDPLFDDLSGMLCFARVVERRSFTAAAAELGASKSMVSTRVARLEERLGERLLVRTTRKLTVTDAGMNLYARCARTSLFSCSRSARRPCSATAPSPWVRGSAATRQRRAESTEGRPGAIHQVDARRRARAVGRTPLWGGAGARTYPMRR
ncbi:LysR family transcriptional regulator [Sorangium sp. So ce131]|uniref:LysR family transcriptional regulator n=1 Tax=Sorangium sp. So ce131 TaxID=3133282 RepID=UPI003F6477F0